MPKKDAGLTLLEILITVAMIALVLVIAIPNFRSYNKDQTLDEAVDIVFQTLKQAQSSATSGILCGDSGKPSQDWVVKLNSATFELNVTCDPLVSPAPIWPKSTARPYSLTASDITVDPISSCGTESMLVKFTGNAVEVSCTSVTPTGPPYFIKLKNSSGSTGTVNIGTGGVISR